MVLNAITQYCRQGGVRITVARRLPKTGFHPFYDRNRDVVTSNRRRDNINIARANILIYDPPPIDPPNNVNHERLQIGIIGPPSLAVGHDERIGTPNELSTPLILSGICIPNAVWDTSWARVRLNAIALILTSDVRTDDLTCLVRRNAVTVSVIYTDGSRIISYF